MKKRIAFLLVLTLLSGLCAGCSYQAAPSSSAVSSAAQGGNAMETALQEALASEAIHVVKLGDADLDMYQNTDWTETVTAAPAAFDLREQGVVPEIRSQESWGTCWGFAAVSACETSILSELGVDETGFLNQYGKEMNLSEKHLAWFGASHFPLLSEYPLGQYPYPELTAQAGEGVYQRDAENGQEARYNNGGYMTYASGIFASGMGPVYESVAPYEAADGTSSTAGDWTLDESMRFGLSFELENSAILPSPSQRDAEGQYVYCAAGTDAIKSELLNGRGVSIAYHADLAMDPDAKKNMYKDYLASLGIDATDDQVEALVAMRNGERSLAELTKEQQLLYYRLVLSSLGVDITDMSEEELQAEYAAQTAGSEEPSQDSAAEEAAAQEAARKKAEELGIDYDAYVEQVQRATEDSNITYMNTDTYAQYTYHSDAFVTHAVTIVGWDDTYAASHFLTDHQPPADGAWIVRNSWGADYGNNGYFYLSYYDQSIVAPETFDFVVSDIDKRTTQVDIMGYDYLQASAVSGAQLDEKTDLANVFEIENDSVLSYVSLLTTSLNTNVNIVVYRLNPNASSPVDGAILDVITKDFLYGGYHRIALNHNYAVPAGSKISVVQTQRTKTSEGTVYEVPYTVGTNQKYMEAQNIFERNPDYQITSWVEGKIGTGESFVCLDGNWTDWSDVISKLHASSTASGYLSYDNLNVKLYAYPRAEIEKLHQLGAPVDYYGAQVRICDDCGYTLVEP